MADTALVKDTTATKKIFRLRKRIRAVSGGTGASKTFSILVWLIDYCQSNKNKIASVVSESYPHLERGTMLDFEFIMKTQNYWKDDRWNKTKHQYTFETGTVLEFFSPDTFGKAHGPRRDVLFANECNHLAYNIVRQLMLRTRDIVWFDWNPSADFWYYTEMEGKRDDIDFLHLTYLDNEALDEGTKAEILSMKDNKYLWDVYGLGKLGQLEGIIYTGWQFVQEIPHEARLISYGLDFGYKNDPAAIVAIYYLNGGYIWDEICFQKGLFNNNLADILKALPSAPVIADSAEPKSIDEMRLYGVTIIGSSKGKGSVSQGIGFVQENKISVTERSVNLRKAYRNYMFKTDSQGNVTKDPAHAFSDLMDAGRYGMQIKFSAKEPEPYTQPPYQRSGFDSDGDYKPLDDTGTGFTLRRR